MKSKLLVTAIVGLVLFTTINKEIYAQEKPNILVLFSDDAGYADFGFQGSKEIKTPNLDKLAKQGMKFQQAYVTAAVCGPSRAGLITGKYQQRFGYEENNVPGYMSESCLHDDEMGLPLDQVTMGEYMQKAGYKTAYYGKWHLGNADHFHPTKRGFDVFYGFRGGARSYFPFNESNPNYVQENYLERGFENFQESDKYLTDALADEATIFIEENKDEPFFVFLAFNAVHTPMHPDTKDLKEFPELSGTRQELAAMTLSMDRACGRVLDKLKELGLDENTIVVFTNDNGGSSEVNASVNKPLSGAKACPLEGGIRVPFLMRWPGVIPENSEYQYPISTLDLLPTFFAAAGGNIDTLKSIDGVNLTPYLLGENTNRPHETLYWKKENRGIIREGDWKLIRFPDRPAELFNLKEDIAELNNLALQYPDRVKEMYRKLFAWERTLERPLWQLQRKYEGFVMDRTDTYR